MHKSLLYLLLCCATLASAQTETATLLVLNKTDNTLTFIDPDKLVTGTTINTGDGPHEVAISDDGKTAFIANYGAQKPGNTISIVDVLTQKTTKVVNLGALYRPHGMVYKNGKLYVTSETSRIVFRYDPATDKIDWQMGHGRSLSHMIALSPDGKKFYTADIYSNSVTVVTIGAPPLPDYIKHIDVGPKPEAIEVSPDGKEVWVGQNDDGNISIINAAGNKVEQQISIGKMPIRIKFSADGKYALVSDAAGDEVVVVDAKTKTILHRLKMEGGPVGIVLSKDSKYAYVALTKLNVVAKLDLTTFKEVGRVGTGINPDGIGLSYIKK